MTGINSGMVMQRGEDNTCELYLSDICFINVAAYKLKDSNYSPIDFVKTDKGIKLTGIPVGGPYQVKIEDKTYQDIYVGDVWILAGQSNMEGAGYLTPEDLAYKGNECIRTLRMNDEWAVANHPLHEPYLAVDEIHKIYSPDIVFTRRAVGPGLSFIQNMYRMTNVPQGVICCAHGGTAMDQWSPQLKDNGSKSLYGAMLRRFNSNGKNVRGLFWYQGCAETNEENNNLFTSNMVSFVSSLRADFQIEIPVVQVQISRFIDLTYRPSSWKYWNAIQELQRTLHTHIPKLCTISSIIYSLVDNIHINSDGQAEIGLHAAEAMYNLLYGIDHLACLPPPIYTSYSVGTNEETGNAIIEINYDNLHGKLISKGLPTGFYIVEPEDFFTHYIYKTELISNKVFLYAIKPIESLSGFELYYGFGPNPYCNVTDQIGRPLPVMGPIRL